MPEDTEKVKGRKYSLLYTTGSLIYFFSQWLMTVIVVKTNGFELAGLFSLAMNVTSAPAMVALFNVRYYQISDVNNMFSNRTYIISRWIACSLALILCFLIALINQYNSDKFMAIMSFMLFKLVESFADVYIGVEQKYNRLDLAGISLLLRGIIAAVVFFTVLQITRNLVAANLCITLSSLIFVFLFDRRFSCRVSHSDDKHFMELIKDAYCLLKICSPLAFFAFLNNYSLAFPKLALERDHGQIILGVLNALSSPTLVIQLLAVSLFAPKIPILTRCFNAAQKGEFDQVSFKFFRIIIILSILCIGVVVLLNKTEVLRTILVALYSEDVSPYIDHFPPICILAILIAINSCLFCVCTLMRMLKSQLLIGIVGVGAAYTFSCILIPGQSIKGTIIALIATIFSQIFVQTIMIVHGYHSKFQGA